MILPDRDATLLRWTKGIDVHDTVGRRVGAPLLEALRALSIEMTSVTVLNDTVASLLGAASSYAEDPRHDDRFDRWNRYQHGGFF